MKQLMIIWNYVQENELSREKAYKGSFNVRISPDLYRSIAIHAIQDGMTLNKFCNGNRTIIRF